MIFLESPWPILLFGIAVEAILAVILIRTGRGILLAAMAGVALFVMAGVVVERLVVTEREKVARTIDGAAAALEANNLQRLLQFVSPSALATREKARWAIAQAEFIQVRIRNLDISIVHTTSPPTAKATFTVLVTGKDRNGAYGEMTRPFPLTLHLRLESGSWLITDYKFTDNPPEV